MRVELQLAKEKGILESFDSKVCTSGPSEQEVTPHVLAMAADCKTQSQRIHVPFQHSCGEENRRADFLTNLGVQSKYICDFL